MAAERPRLLFLNNQGLADVGGGPGILRHLVHGLADDYAVTVASQQAPADVAGVDQVRLPSAVPPARMWRIAPLVRAMRTSGGMPSRLIERADIVVVMDVHAGLALRRRRGPVLYLSLSCVALQERATGLGWPGVLQYAWLERQLAARADAVVVASRAHAAALRRWTGLRSLDPVVLHPVLPGPPVEPAPACTGTVTVLAAGRMVPGKDFGAVLRLADRLRDLPCRWVLAGEGPELPGLKAQADAMGLAGRIRFPGAVVNLGGLLAECDILLHPSKYESFGMVLFEAMQAGRPVLCGRDVGASEIMPPDAGFVLDFRNHGAVEARLRSLITEPAQRAALGLKARDAATRALERGYLEGFRGALRGLCG